MKNHYIKKNIFTLLLLLLTELSFAANSKQESNISCLPGIVVAKLKPKTQIQALWHLQRPALMLHVTPVFPLHERSATLSRIYSFHFDPAIPPHEIASQLMSWKIFEYVEPKYVSFVAETIPNDSLLGRQSHLSQIDMFRGWDYQRGDASTVIAIVDNGTDYRHPDLGANIWTNNAEVAGLPNVDDDGNGYVDDIHGWDFGENDNDPSHGTDPASITSHGTHIAGLASAVTDNSIGVAGVSWNCSIMPVKASTDADTRQILFGYEGIVYAADQGAKVINTSWGRRGPFSQFEQDVIDYAVQQGSLIVAAAGNSNVQDDFYPASYVHVIAVAAVNDLDEKTSYSNYGKFVDISAPGGDVRGGRPGLFSTFPVVRGSYGEFSGTSMASPLVAGVVALLIRKFPQFSPLQIARQVVMTSDPINQINLRYKGLIGYGRVNAFRALTEDVQEEEPAKVRLFKVAFNDSVSGNGNGLFERNEIIGVDAWYRNYAISPGRNLTIALISQDADIIPLNRIATLSHLPADAITVVDRQLNFRIRSQATSHLVQLVLNYQLDNGIGGSDTVFVAIGKSAILLVDDDENGERNVERFYTTVLDQANVSYLLWNHAQLGSPSPQLMPFFPMVIWSCEWAFPSLEGPDRAAISHYLNQGGSLFISGQDIGWDLADPAGDQHTSLTEQFYRDYLHAIYRADHSGSQHVLGVPGTIGQGLEFDIYQPQIPYHFQFPEWIEPASDAQSSFQYENGRGAGVSFEGSHSVLYLGFGFEAVDASQFEAADRQSKTRNELMHRIIDRLGPLRHQPPGDLIVAPDSLSLSVILSPLVDDMQSLLLFWRTDEMEKFNSAPLIKKQGHQFISTIALHGYSGHLRYYFQLQTPYYSFRLPLAGFERPFSISIGQDTIPPELFHIRLNDIFLQNQPREVAVFVQDNVAVDPASVWLHYRTAAWSDSVPMTLRAAGWYNTVIPPIAKLGEKIVYWFSANDSSIPPNRASSELFSYRTGIEGFEYDLTFWESENNGWGLDELQAHSGRYCITSFPSKSYPTNIDIRFNCKFGLPRSQLKNLILSFWTKHQLESDGDVGLVEVSLDHRNTWQPIGAPVSGLADKWYRRFYPLSDFYQEGSDTICLRFRMLSDARQSQPMDGWFIDDIALQVENEVGVDSLNIIMQKGFLPIRMMNVAPNPFNLSVEIHYELAVPGSIELKIFNLIGQLVQQKSLGWQPPGEHSIVWDGRDQRGSRCDSGIYFAKVKIKDQGGDSSLLTSKTMKMVLLK